MSSAWLAKTDDPILFCRYTQMGLLRLLTNHIVMGPDVLSCREAWNTYRAIARDERVGFALEPLGIEDVWRKSSSHSATSTQIWSDAYLAAFSQCAELRLITFDRALALKVKDAVLISEPHLH
jgi:uncharacterized protein